MHSVNDNGVGVFDGMLRHASGPSWKQRNPEKVQAQQQRYYAKNSERLKKNTKEWKARNLAKIAKQRLCEKEKYHNRHNPY